MSVTCAGSIYAVKYRLGQRTHVLRVEATLITSIPDDGDGNILRNVGCYILIQLFAGKTSLHTAAVKVKLSLCLIKHYVMKIYGEMEIQLHHS
jgi:hypothetical protein